MAETWYSWTEIDQSKVAKNSTLLGAENGGCLCRQSDEAAHYFAETNHSVVEEFFIMHHESFDEKQAEVYQDFLSWSIYDFSFSVVNVPVLLNASRHLMTSTKPTY
jgi:hypothetical protein